MGIGGNGASQAAANQQAQTQSQINNSVAAINAAYSNPSRQAQYGQYYTNLLNQYDTQVNNQEAVNARNLKFAAARNGTTGGSAATDANGVLQKDYTQGLIAASQQAQGGEAALENADINSKNNLIGLAEAGAYTGAPATQISQAQNAALTGAQSYAGANALGNLFAQSAGIYNAEETAAGNRRAQNSPIGSPYGANAGASPYG